MKKKVLLIIVVVLLILGSFVLGRQVGLNTEDDKTQIVIKEETVGTQTIKKTLSASGQVSAKTTEKLELSSSYYFKAMCVEDDDTVKSGANILQYTNGKYLTAPYDLVVVSHNVPDTENKCTSSNYIEVSNLNTLVTTISVNEITQNHFCNSAHFLRHSRGVRPVASFGSRRQEGGFPR